ncbi:hypothetical protein BC941DRAFT_201221 [Chlamydoabsidia padenii]|nr:hypothetical protein BC941DRAFT_201221 [Chlamydoabsidia padenii]
MSTLNNSTNTMLSRFEYDDTSTLTTFNLCDTEVDKEYDEGVLSKFISKFKTAVSGQQSQQQTTHQQQQQQRMYKHNTNDEKYSLSTPGFDHGLYSSTPASTTTSATPTTKPGMNDSSYFPPLPPPPPLPHSIGSGSGTLMAMGDKQQQLPLKSPATTTGDYDTSCIPEIVPLVKTSSCDSDNQSVMTNFSVSNSNSLSRIIARLRGEAPNKEYWMPDENCKECFECGAHFNFFRRKHHCRVCGQIFCGKCASHIIQGERISQMGQLRVCNFCFSKFERQEEVASAQEAYLLSSNRTSLDLDGVPAYSPVVPDQRPLSVVPNMQIPTTSLQQHSEYGSSTSTTLALEIPTRPITPRASTSMTSITHHDNQQDTSLSNSGGLKKLLVATNTMLRPRSRTNTMTSLMLDTTLVDGRASLHSPMPFRRNSMSLSSPHTAFADGGGGTILPTGEYNTFSGSDNEDDDARKWDRNPRNVLNFLGGTNSSNGNEQRPTSMILTNASQMAALEAMMATGTDEDWRDQKTRAKFRSKSVRRRLSMTGGGRPIRTRTQSLMRNTPVTNLDLFQHDISTAATTTNTNNSTAGGMVRGHSSPILSATTESLTPTPAPLPLEAASSSSTLSTALKPSTDMIPASDHITAQGDGATETVESHSDIFNNPSCMQQQQQQQQPSSLCRPRRYSYTPRAVEFNKEAVTYMRKMVRQMLKEADDVTFYRDDWEDVLTDLLLKLADSVHPDVQGGDEIDVRHYIKIKTIAGGLPKDSVFVNGVVCSKNVAHKEMARTIEKPKILILLFPLELSRDFSKGEHQLQSINPVLAQEKDFLEKLVNRITALQPTIVLVHANVSRIALDFLCKAKIVVVFNVKLSVLDAVSRCTGASMVSSFLQLSKDNLVLGECGMFEVVTLVHDWIPNRRKSFLLFHKCTPDLGATIILRGGNTESLRAVKHILDFMVFVVHNLRLESSLLQDFSTMRNDSSGGEVVSNNDLDTSKGNNRVEKEKTATSTAATTQDQLVQHVSTNDGNSSDENISSSLDDDDPCLRLVNQTIDRYEQTIVSASPSVVFPPPYLLLRLKETQTKLLALIRNYLLSGRLLESGVTNGQQLVDAMVSSLPDSLVGMSQYFRGFDQYLGNNNEYEQLLEEHTQRWRTLDACLGEIDHVSPLFYQQFVVLYNIVCTVTAVPCQDPQTRRIDYYRIPSDLTLGQYVEDMVSCIDYPCTSNLCERSMLQHYRSYAHGNARVNVQVERLEGVQPATISTDIYTWSYCRHCSGHTKMTPMSDNAWKYSFGKFLELLFYQQVSTKNSGTLGGGDASTVCIHELYRDHVHFFSIQGLAVRIQYETIHPLEVYVPPMHLYVSPRILSTAKDDAHELIRSQITRFYDSVVERNKNFNYDVVQPTGVDICKDQLQEMSGRALGEKKSLLQYLQSVYATTDSTDALQLNIVRTHLQMNVLQWDAEYAELVRQHVKPERELRRLTATHFRKMLSADDSAGRNNTNTQMANVDLRTQKATDSIDLPLLDVGLDGYPPDFDTGLYGTVPERKTTGIMDSVTLHQQPHLGESPTSTSPWIGEEQGFDSILERMEADHLLHQQLHNTPLPSITPQLMADDDDKSTIIDSDVARRLSLELMHSMDYAENSDMISKTTSRKSATSSSSNKRQRTMSHRHLDAHTLPETSILRSKSSPLSPTTGQHLSRIPQRSSVDTRKKAAADTPTHLPRRMDKQGSSTNNKRGVAKSTIIGDGTTSDSSTVKADIPLNGYRYGYKGSTERLQQNGNKRHLRLLQSVSTSRLYGHHQQQLQKFTDGSAKGSKHQQHNVRYSLPPVKLAMTCSLPRVPASVTPGSTSSSSNSLIRSRAVRQRLESKSSIEVYTTVRELVREESDDEFQATDMDESDFDEDDKKDQLFDDQGSDNTDLDVDDSQFYSSRRTFSLTQTDEYDESLCRDEPAMEKAYIQHRRLQYHHNPRMNRRTYSAVLPLLTLDPDDNANEPINISGPQHYNTMPAFSELRNGANIHSSTSSNMVLDSSGMEISPSGMERNSLMKAIANILAEKGLGNLLPLEYPLSSLEHVFPKSIIVVREDEPSTIVAAALSSDDYIGRLFEIREQYMMDNTNTNNITVDEVDNEKQVNNNMDINNSPADMFIERTLRSKSGIHMKSYFTDGTTKFFCKIFFAEQFDALRRNCGCDESYIASLAHCAKWDSSGGKSGSVFLKTKDGRYLLKQISRYEMDAFLKFAPSYFQYMSEAFFHELPTVLCKIFGLYRVGYKNMTTGRSIRMDIMVMENLFYDRSVQKIFDLKGSMRNRHVQVTGKENEVLLDENMVEYLFQTPLFLHAHSKQMLRESLHNDTLFLSRLDVMDYSLLVGIDEEKQELVVGIVDFIRTFTWDKKLESWVKDSGIFGGGGKEPTIISPRQYRIRFREAMDRYFLMVPDFWTTINASF